MTSPDRRREAGEVSQIFHAALTALGFKTLAESLVLWADVPANKEQLPAASGRWLSYATSLVSKRRRHARQLTISYYRLVRALHTGFTIADPFAPDSPADVAIGQLREDFYDDVEEFAPQVLARDSAVPVPGAHADTSEDFSDVPASERDEAEAERIELERIDALEDDLLAQEQAAEEEARIVLEALGPNNLERKLDRVDETQPAKTADQHREELRRQAGNRQAAAAERVAMNGGREALHALGKKDPRVIGWARVSRTGTPCGWCAMLISRGVIYKSKATAGRATKDAEHRAEGETYHDNCHCYAVPVFSMEQYREDPTFNLNREYAALWPKVTDGLGGDEALTAWRRYFRQNQD